jgi:hypothetical protein
MDRRALLSVVGGSILTAPFAVEAQLPTKTARIGILSLAAGRQAVSAPHLARADVKHPEYNEHAFSVAAETAFTQWEALQNVGH